MRIQKLPAEARSKLQSGLQVTDAVQCVLELVQNSLDAEATGIAVRIDLKNYQIRVIDNGKGIGKDDLEFVGERFMTSKYHTLINKDISSHTYGYSGQALSNLQDISRSLTIETKSDEEGPTFVKVFQNNKVLPIRQADNERYGTGTAVTIEDFMYNMPVRRNRISEVLDLEEIKNHLQYLAVIHYNVCFTLRNENKGVILLQTPQASNTLEAIKNIYGKSVTDSLEALHYQDEKYDITGFISIKLQTRNCPQLIYVNRRIVTKGVIHKFINNLIKEYNRKESLFGHTPKSQITKKLKISSSNAFIILIKCPQSLCELFTNIRTTAVEFKNWTEILKCIHRAVRGAFKSFLSLNSSSGQKEINKNGEGGNEEKRAFGTSLLLNAVRGAPVKRGLGCRRDAKQKKKLKLNASKKNLKELPRNEMEGDGKELINTENPKENSNDSLESPIPKKSLTCLMSNCDSVFKTFKDVNQSFLEFYEWLKTKFKSDTNAFKLYSDFLQFKRRSLPEKTSVFKSPVVGGKLKRKVTGSKKKDFEKSRKKVLGGILTLEEEMETVVKNQLKIFPNSQLRVKRGVQFTAEMHSGFPGTLTLGSGRGEKLNFENSSSQLVFRKPEGVPVLIKNQRKVECTHTDPSLPSSEVQFTNIIKFRNFPESFSRHPSHIHVETLPEKGFSPSNTWLSHYQDFVSKNVAGVVGRENYASRLGGREISQRNDWGSFSGGGLGSFNLPNTEKDAVALREVEIQVEILKPVHTSQKVNAMVQTDQTVPETPSFENSFINEQESAEKGAGNEGQLGAQLSKEIISQEVPVPYFWNTSEYLRLEEAASRKPASEIISENGDRNGNEVISTSVEFICGHKSVASSKPQNERSTSKETQTIADIWTESLTEMGSPLENKSTAPDPNLNKSKPESSQLPETIPVEGVDISRHTEPGFCLTGRHDFVPKGLSPEFFNPETTQISRLTPREKNKIKVTIDNAQSDILADIKWQDESTGDCLKPKIPKSIFFEMSGRASESAINYGDPVLSATLSYCAVKVHNLLHSFTFTKDLLSGVEILGQLDKKFIATKVKISGPKKMELISLFDQHAVDERIKLEELINENVTPEGKVISSCVNPPVECKLAESYARVVLEFSEKISSFGLKFESVDDTTILVNQAPSFLLGKTEKDRKNKKKTSFSDTLTCLIVNIAEELTETRGAGSKTPKVLHDAFCLEACHKAVKFNKALSVEQMTEMIAKLQNCALPFQCAHGRPSVIPIIDLEDFGPKVEEAGNTDSRKIKKFFIERKEKVAIQSSESDS